MTAAGEDTFFPLCAPYVLTVLEGEELSRFEAHVKTGCARCADEVIDLAKVVGLLAALVPQVPASTDLRERILFSARLSTVTKNQSERPPLSEIMPEDTLAPVERKVRSARRWLQLGIGFVGVALLIGTGLYVRNLLTSIGDQETYIKTLQRHIALLKNDAESKETILRRIEARQVDIVALEASAVNPFGYGKVIWDPETKGAIVQASNLPPAPEGWDYQLWAVRGEKPVSVGILELLTRKEQESYYHVPSLDVGELREIGAFTVTLEPKGGSGQPTGDVYLLGKTSPKESLPAPHGTTGPP
jgi:anti-sigma-K factor RskA